MSEDRLSRLEARLEGLEDANAISNLMARYLDTSDGGWNGPSHNGAEVGKLFTEDAVWECGAIARVQGRAAIRDLWEKSRISTPFAFHAIANPHIRVSDDIAEGEWRMIALVTSRYSTGVAESKVKEKIGIANYHNSFARIAGEWLISHVNVELIFLENFSDGWSKASELSR